jgi:3-oxoacyl-[acyl-carrier protein] reductase
VADFLTKLNRNPITGKLARMAGLPNPVQLQRAPAGYESTPLVGKRVVLDAAPGGYAHDALQRILSGAGATESAPFVASSDGKIDVYVFDATGLRIPADCTALLQALRPAMPAMARNARVLLLAALPEECDDPVAAATARGMEGFTRSIGKELGKRGATVNLAHVARDAVDRLDAVVRFFCGPQSTYVSGQVVRVNSRVRAAAAPAFYPKALAGKVALVTGAGGGIGSATAERLAQEGAQVVCLDIAAASEPLHQVCTRIGALPLLLDITKPSAPQELAAFLRSKFGGVDIVVHNAGITRDRTLGRMSDAEWNSVLAINFDAIVRIDQVLLSESVLRDEGRIVCLSSISGIAGNFGQTNYALTKAALIGYVAAQSIPLAARGICINAVAPGFIETAMTERMPFMTRELGRRLNALQQGGQPRDAAELIAFLCLPAAAGITGQAIRVCGQGLIGA